MRTPDAPETLVAGGSTGWFDRWLAACQDLAELERSHPMTDAVIDEIDGRMIRIGDHWLADFASCNYLGFDLDREIIASIPEYIERWGTHPSWSRLLGSPVLYGQIEEQLTELLGCEDSLVLPTITLIHSSVIPVLAREGTVFIDSRAHKTIWDGCQLAAAHGATLQRFQFGDPEDLERLIRQDRSATRLICMDGINSMTGNAPDLHAFARIAREYDALLYVDDAHGFGVIGERSPAELSPFGSRGNSIVRHVDETYDHVVLVGGLLEVLLLAGRIHCVPQRRQANVEDGRPPVSLLRPVPGRLAGHGADRVRCQRKARRRLARRPLARRPRRCSSASTASACTRPTRPAFRSSRYRSLDHEDIDAVGRFLFDHGIYVTLAAYPLVPKNEVGFRIQVTAANSQPEIDQLVEVLGMLAARFELQPSRAEERAA